MLIGWLAAWALGAAGWWLGAKVGFATAVLTSAVTGAVGLWLGYRWFDDHLG
jgi:hypothetical protein